MAAVRQWRYTPATQAFRNDGVLDVNAGGTQGNAVTSLTNAIANRVRGIRCGLCWTEQLATWNRSHNDGNVLALGQRTISDVEALAIVRVWLNTEFEGGRHLARIRKIDGA